MEERGDEHIGFSIEMSRGGRRETLGKDREKYKYPLSSNGHLSTAMPLSRCGTAAPGQTAKR
jgi:hypothetical protein